MRTPRPHRDAVLSEQSDAAEAFMRTLDDRFLAHLERLRTEFAKSNLGVALQGAEVRQVRTGADSIVSTAGGRLMGWSIRETGGAGNATVYIRDGVDDSGNIIAAIELAAHESTRDSWFPGGLSFTRGLYVDVTGSIEGAMFLGAVD